MKIGQNEQVFFNNLSRSHLGIIYALLGLTCLSICANFYLYRVKIARNIKVIGGEHRYVSNPSRELVCKLALKELEKSNELSQVFSRDLRHQIKKIGFKIGKTQLVHIVNSKKGNYCDVVFADIKGLRRFKIALNQSVKNLYYFQVIDIQEKRIEKGSKKLIAGDVTDYEERFK